MFPAEDKPRKGESHCQQPQLAMEGLKTEFSSTAQPCVKDSVLRELYAMQSRTSQRRGTMSAAGSSRWKARITVENSNIGE